MVLACMVYGSGVYGTCMGRVVYGTCRAWCEYGASMVRVTYVVHTNHAVISHSSNHLSNQPYRAVRLATEWSNVTVLGPKLNISWKYILTRHAKTYFQEFFKKFQNCYICRQFDRARLPPVSVASKGLWRRLKTWLKVAQTSHKLLNISNTLTLWWFYDELSRSPPPP